MPHAVKLQINNDLYQVSLEAINAHTIREDDLISFSISVDNPEITPEIFFEDATPMLSLCPEVQGFVWRTQANKFFSDCFGQSHVRIYVENIAYTVFFDVRAKKVSAQAAERMISYLANQNESLIRACFSRSTTPVGSKGDGEADPESIISTAEEFVSTLLNYRTEFVATKRTRLVPTRQPMWKSGQSNYEIDPVDILGNLDAISPTQLEGDLLLKGRHYSIGDISVSALTETANVHENKILLGGLYSIRAKITYLIERLSSKQAKPKFSDGYESFDRLLMVLTADGMTRRCEDVFTRTEELIKLFESKLGITYDGEMRPRMTPYARTSKVYRSLYGILDAWYALGTPSLGATNFLLKLKSLWKIYEIFTLFKMVNHMLSNGWMYVDLKPHPMHDGFIPQEIIMQKDNIKATFSYEPVIKPLTAYKAQHLDLVDVAHASPVGRYSYWTPDYVIRLEGPAGQTKYVILDAKYSTENNVQNICLPDIVGKYYFGLAGYDAIRNIYSSDAIGGVIAIYPIGATQRFIPYQKRTSLNSLKNDVPLPIFGATSLDVEQIQPFGNVLDEILERVSRSIN